MADVEAIVVHVVAGIRGESLRCVVWSLGTPGCKCIATTSLWWSPICNTWRHSLQGRGVENLAGV